MLAKDDVSAGAGNASTSEAKEPLTLKVFLAGSTQDRGYSLAESIIDSVATSLAYEWRESVDSFGKKDVVLPQIVVRTAESSQRQDVLTKHIEESDVVLFFLDSFRRPGRILQREMDEALGSFLRTGRPRSYYFLRENSSHFFSTLDDSSANWAEGIDEAIKRHGFFQNREYITYDEAHVGGYLQELSVILVRAMVEKCIRRGDSGEEEETNDQRLIISRRLKNNIAQLVSSLVPAGKNVPEPGVQPEDKCYEVMRLDSSIDEKMRELRISNAELAKRFYGCVKEWGPSEEPDDEAVVQGAETEQTWCSVEVAGIRVLLCGETSNRAREFARETLERIDGVVDGAKAENSDRATDGHEKPYDVALFFLDDLNEKIECEPVIRRTAKQLLEKGWPYPYLFLEENAKDGGANRENLTKILDKYGFMQYTVGYSRDDVAGYMSELLKIVAFALIEKTCYESDMGLLAHFPLQVPSHDYDGKGGKTLAKVLSENMQAKVGQGNAGLDGRTVRQLLYLVNYLLYKSDLDVGLKMHRRQERTEGGRQGIEISGKRSVSVYLSWSSGNYWCDNHIRVFFHDENGKQASRRLDILLDGPSDGPGKVLKRLYEVAFLPWAFQEECNKGKVSLHFHGSQGEEGQLAPLDVEAKGKRGMSYGPLSEGQREYLMKNPFLTWIPENGVGGSEDAVRKKRLDTCVIQREDVSGEGFDTLYAIAKNVLADWLLTE